MGKPSFSYLIKPHLASSTTQELIRFYSGFAADARSSPERISWCARFTTRIHRITACSEDLQDLLARAL